MTFSPSVSIEAQIHPYLRERVRDFKNHGFCIVEQDLVMEDETIWGGYNADMFNQMIVEACEPDMPLITENDQGDMVCRKPRNQQDRLQAMNDAFGGKELNAEDYSDDGRVLGTPGKSKLIV